MTKEEILKLASSQVFIDALQAMHNDMYTDHNRGEAEVETASKAREAQAQMLLTWLDGEYKEMNGMKEIKICPICGKSYTEHSAISRADNKTEICPECGLNEAILAWKSRCGYVLDNYSKRNEEEASL